MDAEVRKLADAASGGPITLEVVEQLASKGSHEQSFDLIDAIARGDIEGSLRHLQHMLRDGLIAQGGKRTREVQAIAMILLPTLRWDLNRLFRAQALAAQGKRSHQITKELRVFRDKQTFLRRVERASREELGRRHELLLLVEEPHPAA